MIDRFLLTGALTLTLLAGLVSPVQAKARLEGGIEKVIATAAPDRMVPVLVLFDGILDPAQVQKDVQGMSLPDRRQYVIDLLSDNLEQTGAKPLAWIRAQQAAGAAAHVRELWIANGCYLQLRADKLNELASQAGVDRLRYDRPLPISSLVDDQGDLSEEIPDRVEDILSWGVNRTGAPLLWAQGHSGASALIAQIDTGVETDHPDLMDHLWRNPGEIPGNGVDDDDNGFIDDVHGWNFYSDDNNIEDYNGHGTSTAGIAVGDGTNGDTTGVAPDATLMVISNYHSGWSSEATHFLAVQYAIAEGAEVITCSMSYDRDEAAGFIPDYVTARYTNEFSLAAGMIQANSTGNNGSGIGVPWNISSPANCPPPFLHPEQETPGGLSSILSCGAILSSNAVPSYSDRGVSAWEDPGYPPEFQDYPWDNGAEQGLLKPDVVAPTEVPTTNRNHGYRTSFNGTSAATPNLGGSLALLRDIHQQATPGQIAEAIIMTAEDFGIAGFDTAFGSGLLHVNLASAYLDDMMVYGSLHLTISDGAGGQVTGVRAVLDNGVIHRKLNSGDEVLERIHPGNYTLHLSAIGYNPAEVPGVAIAADDTTDLEVELTRFSSGIAPTVLNEEVGRESDPDFPFTIENPNPSDRHFRLSFEPRGGLNWTVDDSFKINDQLGGSALENGAAWFDGRFVIFGQRSGVRRFWFLDREMNLVDSLLQPDRFATTGLRAAVAGDSILYGVASGPWIYLLNRELALIDSINISAATEFPYTIARDPRNGDFYTSMAGNDQIYHLDSAGNLVDSHGAGNTANGLALQPDELHGPSLYILNSADAGKARLVRMKLENHAITDVANLSAPGRFDVPISLSIAPDTLLGQWRVLVVMGASGVNVYDREIESAIYELPDEVTIPPDGGGFMFTVHGAALPLGTPVLADLVFRNETDGWKTSVAVTLTGSLSSAPEREDPALPSKIALLPPWPNPFNPSVRLEYELPQDSRGSLSIVNLLGRTVAVLEEGPLHAGRHALEWNATGQASGLYLAVLHVKGETRVRKLMLIK